MNFCPLCYNLLLIQKSVNNNRLSCNPCRYYYPLDKTITNRTVYKEQKTIAIIEQGQDLKELPVSDIQCPKCPNRKAYFEQRQTRSADEAATLFYTCTECGHKWNQNN